MIFSERFTDRAEAGSLLAEELKAYTGSPNTIILALVRGGVEVGRALSDRLRLPLFPYVVRKIGHPSHREFGVGAIAEGGSIHWDAETLAAHGLTDRELQPIIDEEQQELRRRTAAYSVRPRPSLEGKTIILSDDGAATGGTMFAAIADLRAAKAANIIVAIPVAPPDTAKLLKKRADDAVILRTPASFGAVGQRYLSFPQLSDDDVLSLLQSTAEASPPLTS